MADNVPHTLSIEGLDDVLTALPLHAQGDEAQRWIDVLDKTMSSLRESPKLYARCLRKLRILCGGSGLLPSLIYLSEDDVQLSTRDAISQTGYSDLWKGTTNGFVVALKALRVHINDREQVKKPFCREAIAWRWFQHPNIVPFVGVSRVKEFCLVSQWMHHETVAMYIKTAPTVNRRGWALDIAKGLAYMHSINVVHGDLKCANVLVDNHLRACLTDFGLSNVMFNTDGFSAISSMRGTVRWMAPEQLDPQAPDQPPNAASDVYSLSMTYWELFSGLAPYHETRRDFAVMQKITNGDRPKRPIGAEAVGLSDIVWGLMSDCWVANPGDRPGIAHVQETLIS